MCQKIIKGDFQMKGYQNKDTGIRLLLKLQIMNIDRDEPVKVLWFARVFHSDDLMNKNCLILN